MPASNVRHRGFTLLELIAGIVLLSISMSIVITLLAPQAQQSAEPLIQLRATKLGQSLMNEVLSKAYDEHSDRSPPFQRCDEKPGGCSAVLGAEGGENRSSYDDVDDYLAMPAQPVTNSQGQILSEYAGFYARVSVVRDSDYNSATHDGGDVAKRITITVTAPNNEQYIFSAYRGNY